MKFTVLHLFLETALVTVASINRFLDAVQDPAASRNLFVEAALEPPLKIGGTCSGG